MPQTSDCPDSLDDAPVCIRRWVVLLPNAEFNEAALARAIWTLAAHNDTAVHIIAMIDDWADDGQVRLRIALLSALLRQSGIEPTTEFETASTDWVSIVQQVYAPGDAIVCHAEQKWLTGVDRRGVEIRRLSQAFAALHMPVCELHGIVRHPPAMTITRALKVWVLPLTVVIVSLALQVFFVQQAHNWAAWVRQAVLAAYTTAELCLITRLARA